MNSFLSIGIALLIGIVIGKSMNLLKIPAVAGYVITGLIVGISGFNIINDSMINNLSFLSTIALSIIAFNIGSELKITTLKKLGKSIFIIALCEASGAFILVTGIMLLLKQDMSTALILGAVSSATAPAATVMVIKQYKAKGPLTSTLLGVVAVDDAICLMIYAVASAIAKVFIKHEMITIYKVAFHPLMEICLSLFVGAICGIMLSYLVNKAKTETELLCFTVGIILLISGIAQKFDLSTLLCSMAMGVMVSNVSSKSHKTFSIIENFSPPIITLFFILAGSRLDISLLPHIGIIGVAYLVFRILGKVFGASIGGIISKSPAVVTKNIGLGLFSQVGVAIGLAIAVSNDFASSNLGTIVITILLATTIITEIIGPIATKNAIIRAKEINIQTNS
ncbi:cation:proton antiporter [Clostridiaceae bacterium M8S5]|nr:cation:proton antiporter [Clostridiaceae bacterium M8S5]